MDWVEIFRAGEHTDSAGRTRPWTEADLDKVVTGYDPAKHEAPVVIGHPQNNAPAYGWVEAVRRAGGTLLAKFKQLEPAFKEMVQAGRFKKRSVSFYPDGTLRHVGFLGAVPPAIKGLKDVAFQEEEGCSEYEENLSFQGDKEKPMTKEEELERKLAEANKKVEFAEAEAKKEKARADKAEANFSETELKRVRTEIENFVEAGIKEAKILPLWKKQGLVEFMLVLSGQGGEYEFAEGQKLTAAKWFRNFLESFSQHPLFKEMARPAEDGHGGDDKPINFQELTKFV